ncbi:hypothetical protein SBP02_12000 [Pseudomonas benzenivorans]|uniref:Primase C terminal 1 (PriCT-1) n=1 Tax=Pseudomonas benzenivorans TaxID=556533 RepID=A0ABZ0PQR3_9PSED|nr:hypothetical protein [Pseudomonas benzenivorans]WPC03508.1 hypothetical protein SBP02_12000 [Pseudomonas benzenivorans]
MKIQYATQYSARTNQVINREAPSFKDFFEDVLADRRVSENKDGKTFIPSSFRALERTAENVKTISIAVFDIDQKPTDDIITLEEIEDVAMDMGYEHAVYTSYSNTPECPRFRLLIPFNQPAYPEEYPFLMSALVEEFDEFLDGRFSKVLDRCWKNEVSRCYFTFTVHPDRINGSISFYNPGHAADVLDLKMRQSTYGQDFDYSQPSKPRKTGGTAAGAMGRSYELNRLLGAMFRGSTEEQIAQRLLEHDQNTPGFGYFADPQYSRNKPRPGETQAQASLRSCRAFVKSHINWLRRKTKSDFKIVSCRGENRGAVPQHDAAVEIYKAERNSKNGKESAKLSGKIVSGPHAGALIWHTLFGEGYSESAIRVSKEMLGRASIAICQEINDLQDINKLAGKVLNTRIKRRAGTNGYPDQNEIGNIYIE